MLLALAYLDVIALDPLADLERTVLGDETNRAKAQSQSREDQTACYTFTKMLYVNLTAGMSEDESGFSSPNIAVSPKKLKLNLSSSNCSLLSVNYEV